MSAEEKYRIVGKLVIEHQEAKREAELLRVRLCNVGRSLLTVCQQLSQDQFDLAAENLARVRDEKVEFSTLQELIGEYKRARRLVENLAGEIAGLDIKV